MRIVLVEDEPKSREGIVKIIQHYTEHEIVAAVEDGAAGLEAVEREKPDLVISDIRMPGMSGLEMLQQMRARGCETGIIFLTGYSEFEYAHQAIKLHALDYILKPIEIENFMEVIKNAESKIENKKAEQISPESLLLEYVNKQQDNRETLERVLGVNEDIKISLLYFYLGGQAQEVLNEMMYETRKALDVQCIQNYYLIPLFQSGAYVVLVTDTEKNKMLKWVLEKRIVPELTEVAEFVCSYTTDYGIKNLNEDLSHLKEMLPYGFHMKKGKIIDEETANNCHFEITEYPSALETAIQKEVLKQDKDKVNEIGGKFIREVIEGNFHPDQIKEYTIRFSMGIAKEDTSGKNRSEEGQYIVSSMLRCFTERQLTYLFQKMLNFVVHNFIEISITDNEIILKTISFVRENYSKPEVSLAEAADLCNVSQEYLSRLFQQETGTKFISFLQNFRVSMAKRMLLSDRQSKVYEIAEAVGYRDQKYFVSVFKKLCGMTPSEFRKEKEI